MLQFRLHLDYSLLSLCEPLLGESGAPSREQAFTDRVIVDLLLPHSAFDTLRQNITAISSGKAIFDINESSI